MADCNQCRRQIAGTVHEGVGGAFLCDACYDASPKCPGCDRECPPNYLYDDGLCGGCTHCQ